MFDRNNFKRQVKEWIKAHPKGSEQDLLDFCDELIPPASFAANQWLIDHTVIWYKHILSSRKEALNYGQDSDGF